MRPLRPLLHRCLLVGSCRGDALHMESRGKPAANSPFSTSCSGSQKPTNADCRRWLQPDSVRDRWCYNSYGFADRSAACGQERAAVQELSTAEAGRLHAERGAWGGAQTPRPLRRRASRAPGPSRCDHVSARPPALRRPPARRWLGEPGAGEPLCVRRQAAGRQRRHGLAPRRQHVRRPCRRGAGCAERCEGDHFVHCWPGQIAERGLPLVA